MVKHIVCFKLKDNSERECLHAKELLLSMIGNVPSIRAIEVGIDFLHSARSYDLHLAVDVDDREALATYDKDPYHCAVVKAKIRTLIESSIAIDYEY